jgi:hypothetical protein
MMMHATGPADMFPLDPHFLPLDNNTTSMANINPYPSIAPRRERQSSMSSSASSDTNKVYSFVAIPGTNQKKRPRRRYDEIERLYHCNWQGCSKAYGTLNHLNAHVSMQKHVSIAVEYTGTQCCLQFSNLSFSFLLGCKTVAC